MRYVLAIRQPAFGSQAATFALQMAEAILAEGHQISQVFFFQDGVSHANRFIYPASDEINLTACWQELARQHALSLHLCISAAQRRGVVDSRSSENGESNLAEVFLLAGLGEFNQAVLKADRLLSF